MTKLYSIGYANLQIPDFISLLKKNNINVLVDVRSTPYSKTFSSFNRELFSESLKKEGIKYIYMGEELGPRSKNSNHYDKNGQVQFYLLQKTELFNEGISRLMNGLNKGYSIAMMCAEKKPETCHRSLLISEYLLREKKVNTKHIHQNGSLELQDQLEQRLMKEHGLNSDMFLSEEHQIRNAVQKQIRLFAYKKDIDISYTPSINPCLKAEACKSLIDQTW